MRKWIFVLFAVAFFFVFPSEREALADEPVRILVFETTDIHGYLMNISSGGEDYFQYRLACIAQRVKEARFSDDYDDVLLLDGGDMYQGAPVSNLTYGSAVRASMDFMGYDAVVIGNHEFDWDVTRYCADDDGTIAAYEIGGFTGDPQTPLLASNLYDAATGKRVSFTRDYCIVEKAGKQIAVIGYIPDWRYSILAEKIAPYNIDGDLEKLNSVILMVNEKERPDATVVLVHGDPELIAEELDPEQVDLVAGGHTHETMAGFAGNGIPFIQGPCYAQGYASAVLVIGENGSVKVEEAGCTSITENSRLLYDNEDNLPYLDRTVLDISHAAWETVQEKTAEVLGYIDTPVLKPDEEGHGSAGNWITGLMLRATKDQGTVAAFCNSGGIRTNFRISKGQTTRQITVYDIYTISPFGNRLLIYDLSGAELAQQLINGLKYSNYGDQMSGLTFTYTTTGDEDMDREDREYTILNIMLDDGTIVDPADEKEIFRVCTNSYCATLPGSVFENKDPVVPEAEAPVDHECLIELLRRERSENNGYIEVDTSDRAIEVLSEEVLDSAA